MGPSPKEVPSLVQPSYFSFSKSSKTTSSFGVSGRSNHDSSPFYARFTPPVLSDDTTVNEPLERDVLVTGDARSMTRVADSSVALVVTSPPYFAGKAYEEDLGQGGLAELHKGVWP